MLNSSSCLPALVQSYVRLHTNGRWRACLLVMSGRGSWCLDTDRSHGAWQGHVFRPASCGYSCMAKSFEQAPQCRIDPCVSVLPPRRFLNQVLQENRDTAYSDYKPALRSAITKILSEETFQGMRLMTETCKAFTDDDLLSLFAPQHYAHESEWGHAGLTPHGLTECRVLLEGACSWGVFRWAHGRC